MYKTVRKGDASLQYTILPQTDQFNAAGLTQPTLKNKDKVGVKCLMVLLAVVVIGSCVALPFLIDPNGNNLLKSSSKFRTSRLDDAANRSTSGETVRSNDSTRTIVKIANEDHRKVADSSSASRSKSDRNKKWEDPEDEAKIAEGTTTASSLAFGAARTGGDAEDYPSKDLAGPRVATSATSSSGPGSVSKTTGEDDSRGTPSPATLTKVEKAEEEVVSSVTETPKTLPRVTLKLRENETVPQMYMKSGIASYKKGNITTSVLAHGLSLEGLIFKTPEGTIKPWPQKWPFADPASYFQWKGIRQVPRVVYFVILGFAGLATTGIILMTYIQWRTSSRRQRGNPQVLEIESQEEDESTLLGPEMATETVEKE